MDVECIASLLQFGIQGPTAPFFFRGLPTSTSEVNLVGGQSTLLVGCPLAQPKSSGRQHASVTRKQRFNGLKLFTNLFQFKPSAASRSSSSSPTRLLYTCSGSWATDQVQPYHHHHHTNSILRLSLHCHHSKVLEHPPHHSQPQETHAYH